MDLGGGGQNTSANCTVNKPSPGSGESAEDPAWDLLDQLSSNRADLAWTRFLALFCPLILQVTRQFDVHAGRESDSFLFVCAKLSDDGFRRLLSYRRDGPARFKTWLSAVVANLCIDWQRRQQGRFRPPATIAGLPPLDQEIFRLIYSRGMSRQQCLNSLKSRFPALTIQSISEINARLFSLLNPRQRWQLSANARGSVSLDEILSSNSADASLHPEEPGPGPEQTAELDQARALLEAALSRLEPRQRLLLRLRYQQDLTLEEVARLVQLPDLYRANREIQAALAALASFMHFDQP